jgi:hypothetical protein
MLTSYFVGGGELFPTNSPLNSLMKTLLLSLPNFADPKVDLSFRNGFLKSLLLLKDEPAIGSLMDEVEKLFYLCELKMLPSTNKDLL